MGVAFPLGHETIVSECSVLFWLDSVYLSRAGNCILTWICRMPAGEGLIWLAGWMWEGDQGREQSVLDHCPAWGHQELGRNKNCIKNQTKQKAWVEDMSKLPFSRCEELEELFFLIWRGAWFPV